MNCTTSDVGCVVSQYGVVDIGLAAGYEQRAATLCMVFAERAVQQGEVPSAQFDCAAGATLELDCQQLHLATADAQRTMHRAAVTPLKLTARACEVQRRWRKAALFELDVPALDPQLSFEAEAMKTDRRGATAHLKQRGSSHALGGQQHRALRRACCDADHACTKIAVDHDIVDAVLTSTQHQGHGQSFVGRCVT
jgi:hypothetical protein